MKDFLARLFLLGMLAPADAGPASPPPPSDAPRAPAPGAPGEAVVPLFQSDRRVLVLMRIGDGEPYPMVFDTGSDGHSFDRLIAERGRLERAGEVVEVDGTSGQRRTRPLVAARDVRLGGVPVGTIEASVLDYDRGDAMGIVSPRAFGGSLVRLELGRHRARILPRDGANLPATPATPDFGGLPATILRLPDGATLPANLDTGFDGALSLPLDWIDKVPLQAPARVVGRFRSIVAEGDVLGGQVRGTIRVGPVVLVDPDVTFLGKAANVGLPVIRRATLLLDPAGNRSWMLDPAEAGR